MHKWSSWVVDINNSALKPPLVEEENTILNICLEFSIRNHAFITSVNVRLTKLDKVDKSWEVDDKLKRDWDNKTPMENWGRWSLLVKSFQRLGKGNHQEKDTNGHSHASCLIITHFDSIQVKSTHCISRNQRIEW